MHLAEQKRSILAVLAAAAGSSINRDQLCAALWGISDAASRNRLKSQIAQMRKLLPPQLGIESGPVGYRLTGEAEHLDSMRFEALLREAAGSPEAAGLLAAALDLWSGEVPFEGVWSTLTEDAGWRLLALRERAILDLASCVGSKDAARAALGFLLRMFDIDPTRGDVAVALARALAEVGQEIEGLRVIGRHRGALAEIGVMATTDIAELESAILRHEHRQPAEPSQRLEVRSSGRPVLERPLVEGLSFEVLLRGSATLLGEPGAGKSVVAERLAHRLGASGSTVVMATASEHPRRAMEPVHALLDALRQEVPHRFAEGLQLPSCRSAWERLDGLGSTTSLMTRDDLLKALTELLALCLGGPDVVAVLEDVHHLDANSEEVFAAIAQQGTHRLLFTSRQAFPWVVDHTKIVDLGSLSEIETGSLVERVLPVRGSARLVSELYRLTGGNPLYLGLLLDVVIDGDLGVTLPPSLHLAVQTRVARLSSPARRSLELAALLGARFETAAIEHVQPDGTTHLLEARDDGLVTINDLYGSFRHELVADALVQAIPEGRRVSLQDQLCSALRQVHASPESVARQAYAARSLDPLRAASTAVAVAAAAGSVSSWATVIEWCNRGLDALGVSPPACEPLVDLLTWRGTAIRRSNRAGSDDDLVRAANAAIELCDDHRLVQATTELCLHGHTSQGGGVDARARVLLEAALVADSSDSDAACLKAASVTLLTMSNEWVYGRRLYGEAIAASVALPRSAARRSVLMNVHLGLAHPDDHALRGELTAELAGYDDPEAQWEVAFLRFNHALMSGDGVELTDSLARMRELFAQVGSREPLRGMVQCEAAYAHVRGDLGEAERLADRVLEIALATSTETWAMSIYAGLLFPIRDSQGRLSELRPATRSLHEANPDYLAWVAVDAAIAVENGELDDVRRALQQLKRAQLDFTPDLTWLAVVAMAGRAAAAVADSELSTRVYQMLSPYSGRMIWNGVAMHAPVDDALALVAAAMGDSAGASRHRQLGDAMRARLGGAPHLAWRQT